VKISVVANENFRKELKPLLKKFPSLSNDLLQLEAQLLQTPRMGVSLGNDAYKIRLKITSKGKGKSGGARVITLIETTIVSLIKTTRDETIINLLSIYDKSEVATISDSELKSLIKNFRNRH
jgi:mRNA-degrading endonuclease RelE of RelBE toxin-antitoxin system